MASQDVHAQNATGLKDDGLSQVVTHWADYRIRLAPICGTIIFVSEGELSAPINSASVAHNQCVFKTKGSCRLVELKTKRISNNELDYDTTEVVAINQKYGFKLLRRNHKDTQAWVVKDIDMTIGAKPTDSYFPRMFDQFMMPLADMVNLGGMPLETFVKLPGFKIVDTTESEYHGLKAIDVHFECSQPPSKTHSFIRSGTIKLLPSKSWVVVASEVHFSSDQHSSTKSSRVEECYHLESNYPLPKRIVTAAVSTFTEGYTSRRNDKLEYNLYYPTSPPPDSDFTLSAYGLPEPQGVTWERPTPRYVYLLAAAGGFTLLAVVLRWLARRYRASTAPT
jgi:hypothetical protein